MLESIDPPIIRRLSKTTSSGAENFLTQESIQISRISLKASSNKVRTIQRARRRNLPGKLATLFLPFTSQILTVDSPEPVAKIKPSV
jgi:hypothetical protein